MKYKFILGIVAGASSLALAAPFFVHAASSDVSSSSFVPSQACVQALADSEAARLSSMDSMMELQKSALQAHKNALAAAATIADDTVRKDAVKKANEDFRAAVKAAHDQQPAAVQEAMTAVQTACGGRGMGFTGGFGQRMGGLMEKFGERGPKGAAMAERLGMTEDELKAALESGKTIQEIAQEHGVTLPDNPRGPGMGMRGGMRGERGPWQHDDEGSTSSAAE